jgi:hypothetical protein
MRSNFALFAAVAALIVIGIDAWLCTRTMTTAALAGSTFNRLAVTTAVKTCTMKTTCSRSLEWR